MTELVLRVHCPRHPRTALLEVLVDRKRCPRVMWPGEIQARKLGDMGIFNGLALPEGYASDRPITFDYVVGPGFRGRPGPRPQSLPPDWRWDDANGLGIGPDNPAWFQVSNPDAAATDSPHLRYTVRHPNASCDYKVTITRPKLFALLDWLVDQKYQLASRVRAHDTWHVVAHELYVDNSATHAAEWTAEEQLQGWRHWLPTVTLDADLDGLLREQDRDRRP